MKEIAVLVWLIGLLIGTIGLIMIVINYRVGRPLKKPFIIMAVGCVLAFIIVILNDMGKI